MKPPIKWLFSSFLCVFCGAHTAISVTHKIVFLPIAAPCITAIKIEDCGEPLIDLCTIQNKRIIPLSRFGVRCNMGHSDFGKVRKGLYERLLVLLSYLPANVGLVFCEGYRPLWKQKEYFMRKFTELAQAHKDYMADNRYLDTVYEETCKFVSPFINNVPVHCTGAAIDFTLCTFNKNGSMELLDLGKMGVLSGPNEQAATLSNNISTEQAKNRKMLLDAAAQAGLVNYGYEWWHYSYGDRAWAYVEKKEKAIYGLVETDEIDVPVSKEEFFKLIKC